MKNKMSERFLKNKKAQEEMIGFAVIIVVVSVVVLLFLYFSMSSESENPTGYKGDTFLQAVSGYTTYCQEYDRGEYLNVEDLIYSCVRNNTCSSKEEGEKESCEVLESTLDDLINKSWPAGENWPTQGYEFSIIDEEQGGIYSFEKGTKENATKIRGSSQSLPAKSGTEGIEIRFTTYEE